METAVSRRELLAGASVAAAAAVVASTGISPAIAEEAEDESMYFDDPLMGKSAEPILPVEAPDTWNYECDVVVVGTGGGGLTASAYLAEHGLKVITVEKNSFTGGTTIQACAWVGGGSKLMPFDYNETAKAFWGGSVKTWVDGYEPCDKRLLTSLAEGNAECLDWMVDDLGCKWVNETYPDGRDSVLILWDGAFPNNCSDDDAYTADAGLQEAMDYMTEACTSRGVDIMLSTQVTALVAQDGKAIGVEALQNNEIIYIKGEKGVILCAGDMANNREMLKKHVPTAYDGVATCCTMPWNTGECMRMAEGMGAAYAGEDTFRCYCGGLDWYKTGNGTFYHHMYSGDSTLLRNDWPTVGQDCKRFANSNYGGSKYISASRLVHQIGHRGFVICDADWEDKILNKLVNIGSTSPITPEDQRIQYVPDSCAHNWLDDIEKAMDADLIVQADTLEELAQKLGLDPEGLVAAIDEWNACADAHEDSLYGSLPYGYMGDNILRVEKPPFLGAKVGGHMWGTACGLKVNEDMQVIGENGLAIPGLYAGGTTIGGDLGYNPKIGDGFMAGVALTCTCGYLAAKKIVSEL